jgi:hypothetical protein
MQPLTLPERLAGVCRNAAGAVVFAAILVVAVVANLWSVFEHYCGARSALELSGLEQQPILRDPLLGWIFESLMPKASLPQAMALTLAGCEALGFLMIFHVLFGLVRVASNRSEAAHAGDDTGVRHYNWQLLLSASELVIAVGLLVPALLFEVDLFRFRGAAASAGIEDPVLAAKLPGWESMLSRADRPFVLDLLQSGPWAWIALTALGCLAAEWSTRELGQRISQLFAHMFAPAETASEPELEQVEAAPEVEQVEPEQTEQVAQQDHDARISGERPAYDAPATRGALFDPAVGAEPPRTEHRAAEAADELFDVVGGAPEERVTLAAARAEPRRYHFDEASRRMWNRAVWTEVQGTDRARDAA